MSCCNECDECTESTTNTCLEDCGCPIEITSLACIRHAGSDLPCIDVVKGETLEAIVQKINDKFCDMVEGLDGEDGADGQGIDHVSFTGETGTEGQPGQTSEYTLWGDAAETINLGNFVVYNAINGQGIDHVEFTSTDGHISTAGSPGQTDTYTLWGDTLETINLGTFVVYNGNNGIDGYDSGWITINDFNTTYNFGLPSYTAGWAHPKIRVVGKTVFLEGLLMLPLSGAEGGATLLTDVSKYPTDFKGEVNLYTGGAGGYTSVGAGVAQSINPIIPPVLAPSETHILSHFEMSTRPIKDSGDIYSLTLTSIFPLTRLRTDGTIQISTLGDTNNDAPLGTTLPNSPYHMLVSKVNSGNRAPDYSSFSTEYSSIGTDLRESPVSKAVFPANFDGLNHMHLGGFRVKLTTSYPLGDSITLTQIQQAIAQIQE